jgi:hypothetical protein
MDMNLEREYCIDNMSETLFSTMKRAMQDDRNEDAIAICEEWLVDGKDPQDSDFEYIFMNNTTFGDWTWEVKMTDTKTTLSTSFGGTIEKDIPEDVEWIDDAFYIKTTRFGLFTSILNQPLGQHFITGATYEGVLIMSRWHLKCLQDGTLDDYTKIINSGVVGGKL